MLQHIRRLEAAGVLPPSIKIGLGKNGRKAWIEEEVDARIAARIKERNEALAARRSKVTAKQAA